MTRGPGRWSVALLAVAQGLWLAACVDEAALEACAPLPWPDSGPGDVESHFPAGPGDAWVYLVTETGGATAGERRVRLSVTGTRSVAGRDGVVFTATELDLFGPASTDVVAVDATGVTLLESDGGSGPGGLYPYHLLPFPLEAGRTFVQADCSGLKLGADVDGDGRGDRYDIRSEVTVVAEEVVELLSSSRSAWRVDTQVTTTVHPTRGDPVTLVTLGSDWYAAGIGLVRSTLVTTAQAYQATRTRRLLGYRVEGVAHGYLGTVQVANASSIGYSTTGPVPAPAVSAGGGGFLVASALPAGRYPEMTLQAFAVTADGAVSPPLSLQAWGTAAAAAFDGENHLVAFSGGDRLLARRVSPAGAAVGAPITTTPLAPEDRVGTPAVAFGGSVHLVVYERYPPSGDREIRAARIDASGRILGDAAIRSVSDGWYTRRVAVAFDGTNFLVAWMEAEPPPTYAGISIRAARVSPSGEVLDEPPIDVSSAPGRQHLGGVACASDSCLVTWADERNSPWPGPEITDIYAARVGADGTLLDGPAGSGGIAVDTFAGASKAGPVATFDGERFVVVWWLDRRFYVGAAAENAGIYSARISTDGVLLDGPPTVRGVLVEGGQRIAPGVATGPDGRALVAWVTPGSVTGWAVEGALLGW